MHAVCVYCGSSRGQVPAHGAAASALGAELALRGMTLIYGGGGVGLMRELADSALRAGARVVGVIPRLLLEREAGHSALRELHVVESMHERKRMMADFADGFIALPGGLGTLEELFEVWTWRQLGYHNKPLGLLNVDGYFDTLLDFLAQGHEQGLMRADALGALIVDRDPARLLSRMAAAQPLQDDPWWTMRERV